MINLKYKFKSIEQKGNELVATYEVEQPNRYQIAREVIKEYKEAGECPWYNVHYFENWLDQQQAEPED